MALKPQDVRRIEPPAWAAVSPADDDFPSSALEAIRGADGLLLSRVHAELVEYLTDPQLCFDDENFPSTRELTGHYYLAEHPPWYHAEQGVLGVSVMARFVGGSNGERSPDDYLGLEVHLQWLPESAEFVLWRNTDSSVI